MLPSDAGYYLATLFSTPGHLHNADISRCGAADQHLIMDPIQLFFLAMYTFFGGGDGGGSCYLVHTQMVQAAE